MDLNQVNDKIKFLNEVSNILLKVDNDIEKEVYVDKIAKTYGISREAIYAQLNKLSYANSAGAKVLDRQVPVKNIEAKPNKGSNDVNTARENLIIQLLINEGQVVYQKIKDEITPNDFKDEKNRKIAKVLYEELEKGDITNVIGLFESNEKLISHITYILSKELEINDINKAIDDLTNKFIKEKLQEEKSDILKKIVSENLSQEESKQMGIRLKEISKKLVSLK